MLDKDFLNILALKPFYIRNDDQFLNAVFTADEIKSYSYYTEEITD
jgi:hypothetical protein